MEGLLDLDLISGRDAQVTVHRRYFLLISDLQGVRLIGIG